MLGLVSLACVPLLFACHTVVSGTNAAELGYGDPSATVAGYDQDPVERPRVTGWTPPPRENQNMGFSASPSSSSGGSGISGLIPEASEPVAYAEEVLEVCSKRASLGDEGEQAACLRTYRIARVFRSLDKWKRLVGCIEGAKGLEDIAGCESANPPAFGLEDASHQREYDSCLHVLALSMVEEMGPEPMMNAQELRELEPIARDCTRSLVEDERDAQGPKLYYELLDCIDAAQTLAAVEACE